MNLPSVLAGFRRRLKADSNARRALLCRCLPLVEDGAIHVEPDGWSALRGRRGGRAVRVVPFCDNLAFRRLPQLWLSIDVEADLSALGALDVVRRAANVEFYAAADDFPLRLDVPPQWPQDTLVKGRSARAGETLARLAAPGAEILADARVKEILVAPKGLRVTRQLRQGERGAYLLLRQNRFELSPLAPAELEPLIASVERLVDALAPSSSGHRHAAAL